MIKAYISFSIYTFSSVFNIHYLIKFPEYLSSIPFPFYLLSLFPFLHIRISQFLWCSFQFLYLCFIFYALLQTDIKPYIIQFMLNTTQYEFFFPILYRWCDQSHCSHILLQLFPINSVWLLSLYQFWLCFCDNLYTFHLLQWMMLTFNFLTLPGHSIPVHAANPMW